MLAKKGVLGKRIQSCISCTPINVRYAVFSQGSFGRVAPYAFITLKKNHLMWPQTPPNHAHPLCLNKGRPWYYVLYSILFKPQRACVRVKVVILCVCVYLSAKWCSLMHSFLFVDFTKNAMFKDMVFFSFTCTYVIHLVIVSVRHCEMWSPLPPLGVNAIAFVVWTFTNA